MREYCPWAILVLGGEINITREQEPVFQGVISAIRPRTDDSRLVEVSVKAIPGESARLEQNRHRGLMSVDLNPDGEWVGTMWEDDGMLRDLTVGDRIDVFPDEDNRDSFAQAGVRLTMKRVDSGRE